jgi:hypothetical protein
MLIIWYGSCATIVETRPRSKMAIQTYVFIYPCFKILHHISKKQHFTVNIFGCFAFFQPCGHHYCSECHITLFQNDENPYCIPCKDEEDTVVWSQSKIYQNIFMGKREKKTSVQTIVHGVIALSTIAYHNTGKPY